MSVFSFQSKSKNKIRRVHPVVLMLVLVTLPLALLAFVICRQLFIQSENSTLARRQAIVQLAAETLREKFDRVIYLGSSFTAQPDWSDLIKQDEWDKALSYVEKLPNNFSFDTVALFDEKGILKGIEPKTPENLAVVGRDFSYRDYYQQVSKDWLPHVSEVFIRAPQPQYKVISFAVPISAEDGSRIGIILLTIKLDDLVTWSQSIDAGPGGLVYIVDRNGQLAVHPRYTDNSQVVDYSAVPIVQKLRTGQAGVEVSDNPIDKEQELVAYQPVPEYGWGIALSQPTDIAFVERDRSLLQMAVMWLFIVVLVSTFFLILLRNREKIRDQLERQRILLESIGDGVIAIDRNFRVLTWNKAAEHLTGWTQEEALGQPFRDKVRFIYETSRKENIVFIEEAMLFGQVREMENHTFLIRKDGTEIPVGDSAAPFFDNAGAVAGAIIVFRDVSKDREIQLARNEMIFQTVHDLRSPATAIKLAVEMSSDTNNLVKKPEEFSNFLTLIKDANLRMLALINSLLETARKNAGKSTELAVVQPVIRAIVGELKLAAADKKVKVVYQPPVEPISAVINSERLKEVFSNLIDNAIKYNKENGVINISHVIEDGVVKTVISDSGIGISSENMAKIFVPYFRVDEQKNSTGTGLGLYLAKKFTEEAGGKISVESKIGEGSTFVVSLVAGK